jgi:hypothetical protein
MVSEALEGELLERPRLSRRIDATARDAPAGPRALDLVGALFYGVGALVFWILVAAGGVVRWTWAAVRLGWLEARERAAGRGLDQARWPVRPRGPRHRGTG